MDAARLRRNVRAAGCEPEPFRIKDKSAADVTLPTEGSGFDPL